MKVLLIQQKMIGDVLVTSMLAEYLKKHYQNKVSVTYLIHQGTKDVVLNNPFIDEFIFFDTNKRNDFGYFFKILKQLRQQQYNLVIDVYAKIQTGLLSWLSGAPIRISYHKKYTQFMYSHTISKSIHRTSNLGLTIEERLSLLAPLNIKKDYGIVPRIFVTETEKQAVIKKFLLFGLVPQRKTIMISLIGSGPEKTYPEKYMAQIIDAVAGEGPVNILFNYFPSQKKQAQRIYDLCMDTTKQYIYFDLLGNSLREFIAIMSCCDAIIGNDGGAINVAKSLHKPSYIIFSPAIKKESWNTFEDGKFHKTVHLKDFKPQLWRLYNNKTIKEKVQDLYLELSPKLFKAELQEFVCFVVQQNLENYHLAQSVILA